MSVQEHAIKLSTCDLYFSRYKWNLLNAHKYEYTVYMYAHGNVYSIVFIAHGHHLVI